MEADVCVRARGDEWRRLAAHVVDAEAGAVMAEEREDVVVPPTLVPELEHVHVFARQEREERFEPVVVSSEVRGALVKDRAEAVAERIHPNEEELDRVARVLKSPVVRDEAARLDAEAEAYESFGLPRG